MRKILEETITLTIPTHLVQKHAEKILSGNGISIKNFNVLAKTSPTDRFPIPYLATFSIAGFPRGGLKIALPLFHDLQTTPEILRYTN